MLQNILALTVVILAAIISVIATIRSITSKKSSGCDGCSACEVKDVPTVKHDHRITKLNFHDLRIASEKSSTK